MRESKQSNMNSFDKNVANQEEQVIYLQKPQYEYFGERRLIENKSENNLVKYRKSLFDN